MQLRSGRTIGEKSDVCIPTSYKSKIIDEKQYIHIGHVSSRFKDFAKYQILILKQIYPELDTKELLSIIVKMWIALHDNI